MHERAAVSGAEPAIHPDPFQVPDALVAVVCRSDEAERCSMFHRQRPTVEGRDEQHVIREGIFKWEAG
jgi:hypothetical protein